jgi:hypothetical protein
MLDTTTNTRLAPAIVKSASGASLTVLFEGADVAATNAMAFPYTPSEGDTVLVIGQEDAHYVIGVLHARGDMTLAFPANVRFTAPRGGMLFTAAQPIEIQSPEVKVSAGTWTVIAKTLTEKVHSAFRWVKDLASLKAGRQRTQVEGASYERAERRIIKAKKDVRVNGERIHLG